MTLGQYVLKRIIAGIGVWLTVVTLVFFLFQLLPGDPARLIAGERADPETIELIRKELGLDKPAIIRFLNYLNDISPISIYKNTPDLTRKYTGIKILIINNHVIMLKLPYFSISYQFHSPVTELILEALPNTIALAISAIFIALVLSIIFGSLSALTYGSIIDTIIITTSTIGISVPSFFAALVVAWLFGYVLRDYIGLPISGSLFEQDPLGGIVIQPDRLILPALTLGIRPTAILTQIVRGAILEVMSERYVLTGYAKGLPRFRLFTRYILRNALNPVVTVASGWLAALLTGAFFIEYVFSWQGIGLLAIKALQKLDLPVVMGVTLFASTIFIIINIAVDIIYGILDPRVSYK